MLATERKLHFEPLPRHPARGVAGPEQATSPLDESNGREAPRKWYRKRAPPRDSIRAFKPHNYSRGRLTEDWSAYEQSDI